MNRVDGLMLLVIGGCIVIAGVLVYFGALNWFGRLPGDFRYEGAHARFYFPLVSMLIFSLVLSLVLYLFRKLL